MQSLTEAEKEVHHHMATPVAQKIEKPAEDSDASSYKKSYDSAGTFSRDDRDEKETIQSITEA